MATMRKRSMTTPSPALMAALAARPQIGGAPVAGIPGGAAVQGLPGGAPMGGMPGGPSAPTAGIGMKKGGDASKFIGYEKFSDKGKPMGITKVKKMASGGNASSRADGIAQRGKTRGTIVMCGGGKAK